MTPSQFQALMAAGVDGLSCDGLHVDRHEEGYRFETPQTSHEHLSTDALRAVAQNNRSFVTNWYYWRRHLDLTDGPRYAFLRWVERADDRGVESRYVALADGLVRTWGQLSIRVRADDDGIRHYELRHEADKAADPGDLTEHTDPAEARWIAKYDSQGRYRPLKTAPSLRRGWTFPDLDGRALVRTIDFLYPATVHNWYLEREGELDVTHWRETAERQTGIYETVTALSDQAVEWATEACCVDDACCKRRVWDLDERTQLDVDRGDGPFPCREPCSLFVAGARQWAELESEDPRTYEIELTPGEKSQIEALLDAVADGRIEEVRAGDFADDANRYRSRYLRAKRFDAADPFQPVGPDRASTDHETDSGG